MESIPLTTTAATIEAIPSHSNASEPVPPDFDACVRDKMIRANTIMAKPVEAFFTLSLILSITSMPFIVLRAVAPEFVISMMASPVMFLTVPYILFMVAVGLKIASLFGCGAWGRIIGAFRG